jgi:hypothetical protein
MLSRYPDRYKGTRPSSKGNLINVFGSNQQLIQSTDLDLNRAIDLRNKYQDFGAILTNYYLSV